MFCRTLGIENSFSWRSVVFFSDFTNIRPAVGATVKFELIIFQKKKKISPKTFFGSKHLCQTKSGVTMVFVNFLTAVVDFC